MGLFDWIIGKPTVRGEVSTQSTVTIDASNNCLRAVQVVQNGLSTVADSIRVLSAMLITVTARGCTMVEGVMLYCFRMFARLMDEVRVIVQIVFLAGLCVWGVHVSNKVMDSPSHCPKANLRCRATEYTFLLGMEGVVLSMGLLLFRSIERSPIRSDASFTMIIAAAHLLTATGLMHFWPRTWPCAAIVVFWALLTHVTYQYVKVRGPSASSPTAAAAANPNDREMWHRIMTRIAPIAQQTLTAGQKWFVAELPHWPHLLLLPALYCFWYRTIYEPTEELRFNGSAELAWYSVLPSYYLFQAFATLLGTGLSWGAVGDDQSSSVAIPPGGLAPGATATMESATHPAMLLHYSALIMGLLRYSDLSAPSKVVVDVAVMGLTVISVTWSVKERTVFRRQFTVCSCVVIASCAVMILRRTMGLGGVANNWLSRQDKVNATPFILATATALVCGALWLQKQYRPPNK